MNFKQITKGMINRVRQKANMLDKSTKELGETRLNICKSCDIFVNNVCDTSKGGCGCHMKSKVLVRDAKCPKEKW